jgi:type II secretory pathway pseudopilin PulG
MKVSKTAIFLFELMVVILIFSIAAAVCTNVFGKAHEFSTESKALTMAVLKAESVAEEFKAGKAPDGDLLFDKDWKPLPGSDIDDAAYFIQTDVTADGEMRSMAISVKKIGHAGIGPDDVYELQVKSYGK